MTRSILRLGTAAIAVMLPAIVLHADDARRPNVLLIAVDDLNDWVGCLGGHPQAQTPHIDRLAARGTLFANAHCQAPLCNPSRTSLLTGRRPSSTGIYGLAPWFRTVPELADIVTLPQLFHRHGYHTLNAGKIWHGGYPPEAERLAEFDVWGPAGGVGAAPQEKLVTTPNGNHLLVDWGTFPHRDEDKGDWQVAGWAVEQLGRDDLPEPFLMGVGFFLPHVPCYATQEWFDLYPAETLQLPAILDNDRDDTPLFSWYLHWSLPEPRLSWLREVDQHAALVRAYLASTSFVDSQIGRVIDALDASGRADDTVVVLWSDHGWHLGEKGITGKNSLWEPSTRVPLIFAGPEIDAGVTCVQPVELLDIFPTLVELCELEPAAGLEGHSLAPQLLDADAYRVWPAITTHNQGNHTVRTLRHRFIQYADGSREFYDVDLDPEEWNNLIDDPDFQGLIEQHARLLPEVDLPPAPGSAHRILVRDGDDWLWEGTPIRLEELER
jgi:arylsulfatase A-like enzyme